MVAIDKNMIEDATLAYIYSYNIAMKEVHNPNFAVQIAFSVSMLFINQLKQQRIDPMQVLMAAMEQMSQQENENSREDKKGAESNEG